MKKLTLFEIKKVLNKKSYQIALGILLAILSLVCYFATDVTFVDDRGETISGPGAISKLYDMKKEWEGVLDQEKIEKVISFNLAITSSEQYLSENVKLNNMAYSKGQGIEDIRDLLNSSFSPEFRSYDYYLANTLSVSDAPNFYTNRLKVLEEWLGLEADTMYSEKEKQYLIHKYETLETPFYYDYVTGWSQLFEYSLTVIMLMMLVLGFITSGIFSSEFSWRTDTIFFSTLYGRSHAITAKLKAAFILITCVYILIMSIYSIVVLGYLGFDGANSQIQIIQWKSMYNITIWQEYLLILLGGYLGCLFMSMLAMLVSAKTKSSVVAVIIPFILLFVPSFVGNIKSAAVNKVLGLLPDQLLQVSNVLNYFNLYEIGGKVFSALTLLFVTYFVLTLALFPITYNVYKNKQTY